MIIWNEHTVQPSMLTSVLVAVRGDDGKCFIHPNHVAIWDGRDWRWEDSKEPIVTPFYWCDELDLVSLIDEAGS